MTPIMPIIRKKETTWCSIRTHYSLSLNHNSHNFNIQVEATWPLTPCPRAGSCVAACSCWPGDSSPAGARTGSLHLAWQRSNSPVTRPFYWPLNIPVSNRTILPCPHTNWAVVDRLKMLCTLFSTSSNYIYIYFFFFKFGYNYLHGAK
jgi:hypothetical protein